MTIDFELIDTGENPANKRGTQLRPGGGIINRNFAKAKAAIDALSGLNLVAGPVTKLAPGASPTATLTGAAPNYTLNLGLPEGAAGAGAPNSADILAIGEKGRLERSLADAGVPDEPSLILDFVRGVHFAKGAAIAASIPALAAALPGSVLTRSTPGSVMDSDGFIKTAAANVPRILYDPATGLPRGYLREPARTNLSTYSEQLDNAAWSKVRVSVVANAATAPDGAATADKIVEDASATITHYAQSPSNTITAGVVVTGSVYVRAAERSFAHIALNNPVSPFESLRVPINLATGAAGSFVTANGASGGSFVVGNAGNGWWRVAITGVLGSATTARVLVYCGVDGTGSGNIYTGDGSSGLYGWGAQVELGTGPSSYIATGASAVARSADTLTLGPGAWLTSAAGTLLIEGQQIAPGPGNSGQGLLALGQVDGGVRESPPLARLMTTASRGELMHAQWGPTGAAGLEPWVAADLSNRIRACASWSGTTISVTRDGRAPISMILPEPAGAGALTRLLVGDVGWTVPIPTLITKVLFWPADLGNAKLQALSNQAAWS